MPTLSDPLPLAHGAALKNRFVLAPLTNQQSNTDGTASDHDLRWFDKLAAGGHSLLITCATNVQANGKRFTDQLGIYDDKHIPGLKALADIAHSHGAQAAVQLHHAGMKARRDLIGDAPILAPSDQPEMGARAMTLAEVHELRDDHIAAAVRAHRAGFDGVELHGAFYFVLHQFVSPVTNRRNDEYGGDLAGRSRLLYEIIAGIRDACGPDFHVGYRVSLSSHDAYLDDTIAHVADLLDKQVLDYIDLVARSLDARVEVGRHHGQLLFGLFSGLPRGNTALGASGQIMSGRAANEVLDAGFDFPLLGSASIIHNDFPERVLRDPAHVTPEPPINADYFRQMGYSPAFVEYLQGYGGFAQEGAPTLQPACATAQPAPTKAEWDESGRLVEEARAALLQLPAEPRCTT